MNCTRHWAEDEDHAACNDDAPCRLPGWVRDTKPLNADAVEVLARTFATREPCTDMTEQELRYYVHAGATSEIESFNSFLKTWAPKHLFFSKSYPMRIQMAVMHWNENKDNLKRELDRRELPDKGKRARGRMRSIDMESQHTTWRLDVINTVVKDLKF